MPERRQLRFSNIEEIITDARRLTVAEGEGKLRSSGNWTLGQTLNHLAYWTEAAYTPIPLDVPWFVRVIMKLMKKRMLHQPMRAGVRLGRTEGGTLATEVVPTEAGLARLEKAIKRLGHETPTQPSKALGPLTHEEWKLLTCRHAELHLSFHAAGQ